jgi:uncharacterized membrane protein
MKGVRDQMHTKLYTMFFFVREVAAVAGLLTASSARERDLQPLSTHIIRMCKFTECEKKAFVLYVLHC